MADANALSAVRAGATWVSAAVNGMGERCGISDTILLLANLDAMQARPLPSGQGVLPLSRLVQAHSRFQPDRRRPIVGRNAFTHGAALHRRAVAQDEMVYSWVEPARFGRLTSMASRMPTSRRHWIVKPRRHSPERLTCIDPTLLPDARQTLTVHRVSETDPRLVDRCLRLSVDRLLVILGSNADLTGLEVDIQIDEDRFAVASPASVLIPSGSAGRFQLLRGAGLVYDHLAADETIELGKGEPLPNRCETAVVASKADKAGQ